MEYNRKVPAAPGSERQGGPAAQEREMAFGSVTIAEAASGAEQKVRLEKRGLAGWPVRALQRTIRLPRRSSVVLNALLCCCLRR